MKPHRAAAPGRPEDPVRFAAAPIQPAPPAAAVSAGLLRSLTLQDATLLVIGCIVGVGIFRSASSVAAYLPSAGAILLIWLLGGLLSLCGALCYAELAALFPASGGDYVYIRETYGRLWGFLFGWTKLFIERTGTIAVLGVVFADYLGRVWPAAAPLQHWTAAAAIIGLTAINTVGVRWGKYVQNFFTVLKVAALLAVVGAGAYAVLSQRAAPLDWSLGEWNGGTLQAMGLALIFVLWTYGGWTEAAYVADEVTEPTRTVPRAILGGLLLTIGLYLAVNLSYLLALPVDTLAQTPQAASTTMQGAWGNTGATFIACMIVCSAFGALNGYILTSARILYALGKDHALFAAWGTIHPTFHTPARALGMNALLAVLLVCTKTFEQIVTYSTVVISAFYVLAVFGVVLLRKRLTNRPRPYRALGYPWTPLLFCITMLGFIANVCWKEPAESLFGVGLLLLGLPLYLWPKRPAA
jgi:amino acid transporter